MLPSGIIRRFKDHLAQPIALIDNLNPVSRIPFQDRVLAHGGIYSHLKGTVSDIQDLFQCPLHLLSESIFLFDVFPDILNFSTVKIKIVHVGQNYGSKHFYDQLWEACVNLSHLHAWGTFRRPEFVFICIFCQASIQLL